MFFSPDLWRIEYSETEPKFPIWVPTSAIRSGCRLVLDLLKLSVIIDEASELSMQLKSEENKETKNP